MGSNAGDAELEGFGGTSVAVLWTAVQSLTQIGRVMVRCGVFRKTTLFAVLCRGTHPWIHAKTDVWSLQGFRWEGNFEGDGGGGCGKMDWVVSLNPFVHRLAKISHCSFMPGQRQKLLLSCSIEWCILEG